ncbi:cytochrome b/b6 domain-containing protein [Rhizobium sp. S95]|uniref:Cytochrome b/b6 domain-containing protein n=1 Tax=Ciceribacter sichuanensis TaxID=2949647 RepID=A0AAJ1BVQ7_9HYPH|nr:MULTISPECIES: cytochrome b/b6 domain-containing protein [unclassified Ciceribacter]MCM2398763.1 cytochrome b/b6 domain-containing protein [Ciceribacter sp. S95]MCO5957031.1 cytochrome b/b6 domain-containing protein [Ciceribacter sp. S101]
MSEAAEQMPGAVAGRDMRPARIKVWDPVIRLFHWSLVGFFAFSFVTGDEWKSAHIVSGYIIGGLVAIRVLWGLFGSQHARFVNFIYSPFTVLRFLADTAGMRAKRYIGHNPAGGAMVIALLVMIAGIVTTGYMQTTDAYWGVEWVEDTHKTLVYATLGLIALHIAGVVLASVEHRENLVRAMVTGWKRRD